MLAHMKSEMKKYINKKMVIFNIDIKQKQHKNEKWKKDVTFPSRWTNFTLKNSFADFTHNGVAIMTGKINNLIIIIISNHPRTFFTFFIFHKFNF